MRKTHIRIIALLAMVLSVVCQAETENSTKIEIESKKQSVPIKQQSQELSLAELKRLAMIQLKEGSDDQTYLADYFLEWTDNEVSYEEALKYFDNEVFPVSQKRGLHEANLDILRIIMMGFFKTGKNNQGSLIDKRIDSYIDANVLALGNTLASAWCYIMAQSFYGLEKVWKDKLLDYAQVRQYDYYVNSYHFLAKSFSLEQADVVYRDLYSIGLLAIRGNSLDKLRQAHRELTLIDSEGVKDKDQKRYKRIMRLFEKFIKEMEKGKLKGSKQ